MWKVSLKLCANLFYPIWLSCPQEAWLPLNLRLENSKKRSFQFCWFSWLYNHLIVFFKKDFSWLMSPIMVYTFSPPRFMGHGFVVLQSGEMKIRYHQDEPGNTLLNFLLYTYFWLKSWIVRIIVNHAHIFSTKSFFSVKMGTRRFIIGLFRYFDKRWINNDSIRNMLRKARLVLMLCFETERHGIEGWIDMQNVLY